MRTVFFLVVGITASAGRGWADEPPEAAAPATEELTTTVRARAAPREAVVRTLGAREASHGAGTSGDVLRAVENLPGVARPQALSGDLVVRGSSPADSRVMVDGVPLPILYHFGGLTSVIPASLLDRIDLVPGNFSVRYGRAVGGVVDVTPRETGAALHLNLDASLLDVGGLLEVPVGRRGSVALGARRSYLDRFLDAFAGSGAFVAAPSYWDYQAVATLQVSARDRWKTMVYGARDSMRLLLSAPDAQDSGVRGAIRRGTLFHRATTTFDHRFAAGGRNHTSLSVGVTSLDRTVGEAVDTHSTLSQVLWRDDLQVRLGPDLTVVAGVDVDVGRLEAELEQPAPGLEGQADTRLATSAVLRAKDHRWIARPAAFVETQLRPVRDVRLDAGVRFDWFGDVVRGSVDPRATLRVALAPNAVVVGAVGLYSQAPTFDESNPVFGRPRLPLLRAVHYGLGVEAQPAAGIDLGVQAFAKSLWDLVSRDDTATARGYDLGSEGVGRIFGIEVMARASPAGPLFGWLSYTLSKSERRDRPGDPFRPFDFDQRHILTAVGGVRLGAGWELGARFRFVTGNPYTPVEGPAYYDADADAFAPRYGATNAARLPAFHQLDLRLDKRWTLPSCAMHAFIDVQNAYDRRNVEGRAYGFDYRERVFVRGVPILPILGAGAEF